MNQDDLARAHGLCLDLENAMPELNPRDWDPYGRAAERKQVQEYFRRVIDAGKSLARIFESIDLDRLDDAVSSSPGSMPPGSMPPGSMPPGSMPHAGPSGQLFQHVPFQGVVVGDNFARKDDVTVWVAEGTAGEFCKSAVLYFSGLLRIYDIHMPLTITLPSDPFPTDRRLVLGWSGDPRAMKILENTPFTIRDATHIETSDDGPREFSNDLFLIADRESGSITPIAITGDLLPNLEAPLISDKDRDVLDSWPYTQNQMQKFFTQQFKNVLEAGCSVAAIDGWAPWLFLVQDRNKTFTRDTLPVEADDIQASSRGFRVAFCLEDAYDFKQTVMEVLTQRQEPPSQEGNEDPASFLPESFSRAALQQAWDERAPSVSATIQHAADIRTANYGFSVRSDIVTAIKLLIGSADILSPITTEPATRDGIRLAVTLRDRENTLPAKIADFAKLGILIKAEGRRDAMKLTVYQHDLILLGALLPILFLEPTDYRGDPRYYGKQINSILAMLGDYQIPGPPPVAVDEADGGDTGMLLRQYFNVFYGFADAILTAGFRFLWPSYFETGFRVMAKIKRTEVIFYATPPEDPTALSTSKKDLKACQEEGTKFLSRNGISAVVRIAKHPELIAVPALVFKSGADIDKFARVAATHFVLKVNRDNAWSKYPGLKEIVDKSDVDMENEFIGKYLAELKATAQRNNLRLVNPTMVRISPMKFSLPLSAFEMPLPDALFIADRTSQILKGNRLIPEARLGENNDIIVDFS